MYKHSSQEAKKNSEKWRIVINSKFQNSIWYIVRSLSQRRKKKKEGWMKRRKEGRKEKRKEGRKVTITITFQSEENKL